MADVTISIDATAAIDIKRLLEGFDESQRKPYLINIMVAASTRQNALESLRDRLPFIDEAFNLELQARIDAETQIIADCYQAIKDIDTESK